MDFRLRSRSFSSQKAKPWLISRSLSLGSHGGPARIDPDRIRRQLVRIVARIRPACTYTEERQGKKWMKIVQPGKLIVVPPGPITSERARSMKPPNNIEFKFRQVLDERATQMQVFKAVGGPVMDQLLHGGNGLIITTGASRAGKTYTMVGLAGNERGLVRRSFEALFKTLGEKLVDRYLVRPTRANSYRLVPRSEARQLAQKEDQLVKPDADCLNEAESKRLPPDSIWRFAGDLATQYSVAHHTRSWRQTARCRAEQGTIDNRYAVFVSLVEVHGSSIYDLIDNNETQQRSQPLVLREDAVGRMYVQHSIRLEVRNVSEAMVIFQSGMRRLEELGGRSHMVLFIYLAHVPYDTAAHKYVSNVPILSSQLVLADLLSANSEAPLTRLQNLRHTTLVNKTIFTLHACLRELRENQLAILGGRPPRHCPPLRESKLTQLLKHYFNVAVSANIVCITHISQAQAELRESMRALRFAEHIRELDLHMQNELMFGLGVLPNQHKWVPEHLDDYEIESESKQLKPLEASARAGARTAQPVQAAPAVQVESPPQRDHEEVQSTAVKSAGNSAKNEPLTPSTPDEQLETALVTGQAAPPRFLTSSFEIDHEAITTGQNLWIPDLRQSESMAQELKRLISRRNNLINGTMATWTERRQLELLSVAPSAQINWRIRDILKAQLMAMELLQVSTEEQGEFVARLSGLKDESSYKDFGHMLQQHEKRTLTVENMLRARNEQLAHYGELFGVRLIATRSTTSSIPVSQWVSGHSAFTYPGPRSSSCVLNQTRRWRY